MDADGLLMTFCQFVIAVRPKLGTGCSILAFSTGVAENNGYGKQTKCSRPVRFVHFTPKKNVTEVKM